MKKLSSYTLGWLAWLAAFGVLEWHAIARAARHGRLTTLSDHVDWLSRHPAARAALWALGGWLTWHWWGPRAAWRNQH